MPCPYLSAPADFNPATGCKKTNFKKFFFFLAFFRYCLDEYGTARRTAVVRCFVDALTRGGMQSIVQESTPKLVG